MVTILRVSEVMVFVSYKRRHFDYEQRTCATQTPAKATRTSVDAETQVDKQTKQVVATQTARQQRKEAATQVGRRTKIGAVERGTQVQATCREMSCQVTTNSADKDIQAGRMETQETSMQTDRPRRKSTATQVGGLQRERNPSEAAEEWQQQKGEQGRHMVTVETARGSQVQAKLVEAMALYQRKSVAMIMCQRTVAKSNASKKCGTPGAGEEKQVEEEKQMVVDKLKHTVNSQLFANWHELTNEFRKEKKEDVILA